jgi:hypothetical protein
MAREIRTRQRRHRAGEAHVGRPRLVNERFDLSHTIRALVAERCRAA